MELDKLLLIWIIILLIITIVLIYLDYTNNSSCLNILFKYTSNILSLIIFISIYLHFNRIKIGSDDIITDIYHLNETQFDNNIKEKKEPKYESMTVKELLEFHTSNTKKEILNLEIELNNINLSNKKLISDLENQNKKIELLKSYQLLNKEYNTYLPKITEEIKLLNNKIDDNNDKITKLRQDIKNKQNLLQKYQKDYNSFLPTLVNKFLGKLKKKTEDGHIYGLFPPSSGYGLF